MRLDLEGATGDPLGSGGADDVAWLVERATAALCATAIGICEEALRLTAEYTKTREQFDRPIATFQAVGQRAADAYVDAHAVRLTMLQAAWRLTATVHAAGLKREIIRAVVPVVVLDRAPEHGRDVLPARAAQLGAAAEQLDDRLGAACTLGVCVRGSHVTGFPSWLHPRHP